MGTDLVFGPQWDMGYSKIILIHPTKNHKYSSHVDPT